MKAKLDPLFQSIIYGTPNLFVGETSHRCGCVDSRCYHITGVELIDLELDNLDVSNIADAFFSVDGG